MPVPGVYCHTTYDAAQWYPCLPTTVSVTFQNEPESYMYAGGSLIATDGTHPMRAVVRVMASKHDALWRRKDHVWLFKPDDLHIAHVYWSATRPELIHRYHLLTAPYQALHVQVEPIEEIQRREKEARSSYISELDITGHAR